MKVFILDNHDARWVMRAEEAVQAIGYELENMEPGDDISIECKEMTEEELEAVPEM